MDRAFGPEMFRVKSSSTESGMCAPLSLLLSLVGTASWKVLQDPVCVLVCFLLL
jgi:hypothetical protein